MKRTVATALLMLAVIWVMASIYERLPQFQGWLVFGALAGVAMSRRCCDDKQKAGAQ